MVLSVYENWNNVITRKSKKMATAAKKKTSDVFSYPKRVERLAQLAALRAQAHAKELGLSVTYILDEILVQEDANGKIKSLSSTAFKRRRIGAKDLKVCVRD
jgi:hypothetical protein